MEYVPGQKTWVAYIRGTSRKFGLSRDFIGAIQKYDRKKKCKVDYLLENNGLYEVSEKGERGFVLYKEGKLTKLDRAAALSHITLHLEQRFDQHKDVKSMDFDDYLGERLAKINGEGGIVQ